MTVERDDFLAIVDRLVGQPPAATADKDPIRAYTEYLKWSGKIDFAAALRRELSISEDED